MKINKNIFLLFLGSLFFCNCKNKSTNDVSFEFAKSVKFELDVDIDLGHRINAKYFRLYNRDLIISYSTIDQNLHYFDLGTLSEVKKIDLSKLPDNIDVRDFILINEDTLLVSTQLSSQYYFVNSNGKVLKTVSLQPKNAKKEIFDAYGNFNGGAGVFPMIKLDANRVLLQQKYFTIDPSVADYSTLLFLNYKFSDSISVEVSKMISQNNLFRKTGFDYLNPYVHHCLVNGELILGHYSFNSLTKFNINQNTVSEIATEPSNFLGESGALSDSAKWRDAEFVTKYDYYSAGYKTIVYDPFNDLIYRVVSLSAKDSLDYKTPYINVSELKPFSIMIYDNNLNFLNEIKFPAKRYSHANLICTPDGVLIDIKNKFNPNFSTKVLEYDLFKIVKK